MTTSISTSSHKKRKHPTITLSVSPVFASNLRAGVEEMLDSMIMRYIPSLSASINADCPFAICNVGFDATVWSPSIAMKLAGKIILYSPDHVSLLIHRTFNNIWEFEYGPAENDPEYGEAAAEASVDREGDTGMKDIEGEKAEGEEVAETSGQWVHRVTGTKLGGADGYLEFTVIGKTVANEMLSLQGSIQPDPFSEEHLPNSATQSGKSSLQEHHPGPSSHPRRKAHASSLVSVSKL
ncbi:uncharacterized protein EDB91DRAFT_1234851 [Suillus paluster]|uniref:uncharacterized protein n=1 Tax=Suillus paluster TaxID=48578 RepID=UPI001B861E01|nr:uncharacterized protein EDB91DRAFT_1234851 [Suillus paluster]KAG1751493.1 hypothetical protein EDB91DRAFT_1234851 [Suillus paluster]